MQIIFFIIMFGAVYHAQRVHVPAQPSLAHACAYGAALTMACSLAGCFILSYGLLNVAVAAPSMAVLGALIAGHGWSLARRLSV